MVLENVCAPALLYLAFSIIQIIIDMYRGETIQAFFKFIVMIIFTIVLNAICNSGMTIISWFIVFIPFILMTYVTTILFFIFGINPSKMKPSDKKCWETQFGCCDDGVTTKEDPSGRSCPRMQLSNVLMVREPTAANNKDNHYLYPQGRSSRDYSIGGGNVMTNKGYLGDNNKDNDYYDAKRLGKFIDMLKSDTIPDGMDIEKLYWKSKLNNSDWNDDKEVQDKISSVSKPVTPDLQDKSIISYLLSLLAQTQPKLAAPAGGSTGAAPTGGSTGAAPAGGSTGAAPSGGSTGAAPSGGSTGAAPSGGSTGAAPSGGSTGAAPAGGSTGTAPTGGSTGTAPTGGSTGTAPAGGSTGTAPTGGSTAPAPAPVQTTSSVPPPPVQTTSSVPPPPVPVVS